MNRGKNKVVPATEGIIRSHAGFYKPNNGDWYALPNIRSFDDSEHLSGARFQNLWEKVIDWSNGSISAVQEWRDFDIQWSPKTFVEAALPPDDPQNNMKGVWFVPHVKYSGSEEDFLIKKPESSGQ